MTSLLRKIFIKDYKNVTDPKVREKHGLLASFVGIITNLILFAFKLLIGILTFSLSIIIDAINNLTDMASCIVNLVGFKMANKPADKKHPYGHERIEYIAGMIISFIIIALSVVFGYQSIMKIINNEGANPNLYTFIILSAAILLKIWQGFFYKNISKAINSVSLKASSQDSFNDVLTTAVILIASIVEYILLANEINIPFSIDGVMGVLVALFIIVMGIKMVIEVSNPLIGEKPDRNLVKSIVNDILKYPGVLGIHDVMFHSYGPTKEFMTAHVEVDSERNVLQSHDLIDNIENEIGEKYKIQLTIHMDPIQTHSEEVNYLKEQTKAILEAYNVKLMFHDFRIVAGPTHTNVIFDVLVDYDIKDFNEQDFRRYLANEFNKIKTTYNLVVKIDHDYVDKD